MRTIAGLLLVGGLFWTGCARVGNAGDAGATSAAITSPVNADPAQPVWTYAPEGDSVTRAAVAGRYALVTESARVVVLDALTGKVRTVRTGIGGQAAAFGEGAAIAANFKNGVTRFELTTGAVDWQTRNLCPLLGGLSLQQQEAPRRIQIISVDSANVFVGCGGGRLIRLDGKTGHVLATSDAFGVDGINEIQFLPKATLEVDGWASGAITRSELEIVHAANFAPIAQQEFTNFLGVAGDAAILHVTWICCSGTPDAEHPGSILRVPLGGRTTTGAFAVQLKAQGVSDQTTTRGGPQAAAVGGHLIFERPPMLYDYGNLQAPAAHSRALASDLTGPSTFFRDGHVLVERMSDTGPIVDLVELVPRMRLLRRFSVDFEPLVHYDARSASLAFELQGSRLTGSAVRLVRVRDGATVAAPSQCRLLAASKTDAIAQCTFVSGRLVARDVEDFKFETPRASPH